jgi:hypothetical protein
MGNVGQTGEVVDLESYRRRRAGQEPVAVAAMPTAAAFAFFWMPMIVFVPVWRLD